MSLGPWAGLRVLERTGLTGAYATRMWAALGADIVVAEPPDGHVLRHLPPFAPGHEGPEASLWWAFFGQGKRSVVAPPGSAELDELLAVADVVIADVDPAVDDPSPAHAEQVVVAVSPFGLTGDAPRWQGSELVAWASAGVGITIGFPDRPPLCPATPVQFAAHLTSLFAVIPLHGLVNPCPHEGHGAIGSNWYEIHELPRILSSRQRRRSLITTDAVRNIKSTRELPVYKFLLRGESHCHLIHTFIWRAFNGDIPEGCEVDH